ncbi:MAG: tryptophan--tRNA ligase [bacterium]|nr:tryptophan--tRNA ligase [bacterium]
MKKILLSGIQPSGKLHIGNYFGALKQFVDLQESHECYIFIANYHALTTVTEARTLRTNTHEVAIDYLAAGLDPEKTTLYLQSDVPEVTELAWIFECITTVPYLERAHAFKDAEAKSKEINAGLMNYPMLMAADILVQDADVVPVGADQKQHIEYARDTAEKFNRLYGDTFTVPKAHVLEKVAIIPGTDGRKMSKSYGNVIPLFATPDEVKGGVMAIPTDSKGITEPKNPDTCNVFALHRLFSTDELPELEMRYREGKIGYHESKEILVRNMDSYLAPLRERREKIAKDAKAVAGILKAGGDKARARAAAKMKEVREAVGLV